MFPGLGLSEGAIVQIDNVSPSVRIERWFFLGRIRSTILDMYEEVKITNPDSPQGQYLSFGGVTFGEGG